MAVVVGRSETGEKQLRAVLVLSREITGEELRKHLLSKYGIGVISLGESDLRVAFSCVEEGDVQELFDTIYAGIKDLSA